MSIKLIVCPDVMTPDRLLEEELVIYIHDEENGWKDLFYVTSCRDKKPRKNNNKAVDAGTGFDDQKSKPIQLPSDPPQS